MGKCHSKTPKKYKSTSQPKKEEQPQTQQTDPELVQIRAQGSNELSIKSTNASQSPTKVKPKKLDVRVSKLENDDLKPVQEQIKRLEKPESISLLLDQCSELKDSTIDDVFSELNGKDLSYLKSMILEITWAYKFTNDAIQRLSGVLKQCKILEHLTFKIGGYKIGDQVVEQIIEGINDLKKLKTIALKFEQCHEIKGRSCQRLAMIIKRKDIEHLELDFRGCEKLDEATVDIMLEEFSTIKSLKALSLDCTFCERVTEDKTWQRLRSWTQSSIFKYISDHTIIMKGDISIFSHLDNVNNVKELKKLSSDLQNHPLAKNILVDFSNISTLTDDSIETLCEQVKSYEETFTLSVILKGCKQLTNKSLTTILNTIQDLTKLKVFMLDMQECDKINDDAIEPLAQSINQILGEYCSCVGLQLTKTGITPTGFSKLKQAIKDAQQQSLKPVDVDYFYQNISSLGLLIGCFQLISYYFDQETLYKSFANITDLYIDFDCYQNETTDDTLEVLKSYFENFLKIQTFVIDLSQCKLFSKKGMDWLKVLFNSFVEVRNVKVTLNQCDQLVNSDIDSFVQRLEGVDCLENFVLRCKNLQKVGDKVIEQISELIHLKRETLKVINLEMNNCITMTDRGLLKLVEGARAANGLQNIDLDFRGCEWLSQHAKQQIEQELAFVPEKKIHW